MRYAPEHNEEARERIVAAASRRFREQGIAGVGLAAIMSDAGLTVGAFYTHFSSKEALVRTALDRSLSLRRQELGARLREGDLEGAVRQYLSGEHRDHPGMGCPTAALVSEVARQSRSTRQSFAKALEPSVEDWAAAMTAHRGVSVERAEAAAFVGLLAGILQLARATPDPAESRRILEAGIGHALAAAGARAGAGRGDASAET